MKIEGSHLVLEYRSDIDKLQRIIDVYRHDCDVEMEQEIDESFAKELDKISDDLETLWYSW